MTLNRRKFIQLGSTALAAIPFSKYADQYWIGDSLIADQPLYEAFKNPNNAARPFVRWWWNGGRINEKELVRELDLLKEKGITGVEINPIAFPANNNPMDAPVLEWLSEDWLSMLQKTLAAAKARNITCDIIVGSGWPFGGEFLQKDEQIQLLALGTKKLAGNQKYTFKIADLLSEMDPLLTRKAGTKELYQIRIAPANQENFDAGVKVPIKGDEITVELKEGEHIFHYLIKLTGYTAVTHGAPGASGPVLNHYHKEAVQKYLTRMSDAITNKIGVMGDHFRSVFIDSLELRGSNWCEDLVDEFKKRRGYDLAPYLPFVLFKLDAASAYNGAQLLGTDDVVKFSPKAKNEIERVRYDFEITRLELFDERFLKTFTAWCKQNKVKSRAQAYGREYYTLESAMQLDIPECETWLRVDVGQDLKANVVAGGRAYRPVNKFAASAALLTGKNIVSCEEITNTSMVFNDSLERIKITGDQSNLSGVTHSILHGFNYSPKEVPFPGWVRYGSYFNERNTWWPYLKRWIDYKARLSAVFQAAEMQSDIAIMFPAADTWSTLGLQYQQRPDHVLPAYANSMWEAIHQNGSGCDYITESILVKSKFADGQLQYGKRRYKTLFMLEIESISLAVAEALKKFVDAGGRVIFVGKDPHKTYGLVNHSDTDKKVSAAIQSLKKANPSKVISYPAPQKEIMDWYTELQSKLKVPAYVKFDKPVSHVSQVHYKHKDADVFFISNYHLKKGHEFLATFNIQNRTAWVWDPETGEKSIYPTSGAKNILKINLDPAQSMLIAFTDETKGKLFPVRKTPSNAPQVMAGSWNLTLEKVDEAPRKMQWSALKDFKGDPELERFAGIVYYENEFNVTDPNRFHSVDLGEVYGISEVEINGKPIGAKWYGKHIYPVQGSVKPGKNTIRIKITTTLGNYAKSLKDNKVTANWVDKQPIYSAGLVGPVRLI